MNLLNKLKARKLKNEINFLSSKHASSASITETDKSEPVLIYHDFDDHSRQLIITLFYTDLRKLYRATFLAKISGEEMFIQDIKVLKQPSYSPKYAKPFNKGYGTVLMNLAEQIAKNLAVNVITGDMVSDYPSHRVRQIAFYTKHGFEINNQNKLFKKLS